MNIFKMYWSENIMKKIVSYIVSILILVSVFPLNAFAESAVVKSGTTGSCTWTLDGTVLTISGKGAMGDCIPKELTNPAPGSGTFTSNSPWGTAITKVVIENGVTSIGKYCFFDSNITEVIIPNSVTVIDENAFLGCCRLGMIEFPNSLKSIGASAFNSCSSLVRVILNENISSIGADAFSSCVNLSEIFIPNNVVRIGAGAFSDCKNLTRVDISNIEKWCNITFGDLKANPLYYAHYLYLNDEKVTNITLPRTLTTIKNYAFVGIRDTAITIYENITDIGRDLFYNSSYLTIKTTKNSHMHNYYIENKKYIYYCTFFIIMDEAENIEYNVKNDTMFINGDGEIPNFNLFSSTPWYEYKNDIKRIIIDKNISKVGTYSFAGFDNLKEVITENPNLKIGLYALNNENEDLYVYSYSGNDLEKYCNDNSIEFSGFFETSDLVDSVTESTIYMKIENEKNTSYKTYRYSWSTSGAFTSLNPETNYIIYSKRLINGITTYGKPITISTTKIETPVLSEVYDNAIYVKNNKRLEYSTNLYNWKTGDDYNSDLVIFSGLNPATEYNIYARIKGRDSDYYKYNNVYSEPLKVTTKKRTISRVEVPVISEYKTGYVTLLAKDGYEYCIYTRDYKFESGGKNSFTDFPIGGWQSSSVFTGIEKNKTYILYQRKAETDTDYASEISLGRLFSFPDKPEIISFGATKLIVKKVNGYEYSLDKINWQSDTTFTNLVNDMDYTIYQRLANTNFQTEYVYQIISEGLTFHTDYKDIISAPLAPILLINSSDSVTLKSTSGYEYKMDNGEWQSSNVFAGLAPNSTHKFYQRIAETDTAYASEPSEVLTVTTLKNTVNIPSAPTALSKTANSVTLKGISGYEYKMDNGEWQSSNVFTGLAPNSTHKFYQRIAETDIAYVSEPSEALTVATLKNTVNAPSAPTVLSKTANSVTLKDISGYEYSADGKVWQKSNVFTGLTEDTEYTFYQRIAETDTTYVSESSAPLKVKTDKSYTPGDLDGDEGITDSDVLYLLKHTFRPEKYPVNQPCDYNGDGEITDADAVYLLKHIFRPEKYPLTK